MVKVKDPEKFLIDGSIDVETWITHLAEKHKFTDVHQIRNACVLSQLAGAEHATETGQSCLQQGLEISEILVDLEMDQETIAAAIVYDSLQFSDLTIEDIAEQLGHNIAKLVTGVERMNATHDIYGNHSAQAKQHVDNIRKMLLAMVDDVRVVVIKLAERLQVLRTVAELNNGIKKQVAKECLQIYAPLANRLGIWQIKWEMEDLSFRYLEPDSYKEIAQGLNARRVDRDRYVEKIVSILEHELHQANIHKADVYGRAKHIHSIHRKMQHKNIDLSEIYDATAVRVLVPHLEDCYTVLGIVNNLWQSIPAEFDDYINNPKSNGYRSLHTAFVGPEDRIFEVQIRTHQMHEQAELGVAAHWKYKEEDQTVKTSHERKIKWLREVLAWQKELSTADAALPNMQATFLEDRVYVFTPNGDILDLQQGATPLDFAYHVHSEVGHRCRGAKINNKIVQLTYPLKTGDHVEILTSKQSKPSRDWLNPHLGYVKTPRAKSKILHWFKLLDFDRNRDEGREILEHEIRRLNLEHPSFDKVAKTFNLKNGEHLLAAIGRGDIRLSNIIHHIAPEEKLIEKKVSVPVIKKSAAPKTEDININGVGNLLTNLAKCCQPVPGDNIVGYITIGRGITIHRDDCPNIIHTTQKERILTLDWGTKVTKAYPVDIIVEAYDRHGLLRDITTILGNENTSVLKLTTTTDKQEHKAHINLTLEIDSLTSLSRLLDKLKQVPNVVEAKRLS